MSNPDPQSESLTAAAEGHSNVQYQGVFISDCNVSTVSQEHETRLTSNITSIFQLLFVTALVSHGVKQI